MKNIFFTLILLVVSFSCDNHKKNDLTRNNLNGNVKSVFSLSFEAIEKEGKIIKADGDWGSLVIHEYDNNGYIIETRRYNNGGLTSKIIYEHDDNGNSIEQNEYNWDGELLSKWTSEFDTKGNEMKNSIFNSDGELYIKFTAEYDDKGNRIELNAFNSDDELLEKHTYDEYDDKGNLIKEKQYLGEKLEDEIRYEYEFDDKENWIQQITFINDKASSIVEREISYYVKSGDDKPMEYMYLSQSSKEYKKYIYNTDGVKYYKQKKFNGEISKYNEKTGYLNYTTSYQDGLEHGTSNWYFPSGRVYTSTNYVKGKRQGSEKKYNPYDTGKLLYIIEYDNDTIKESKTYNDDIMIGRELVLGNNALHIEQYDSSGEIVSKGRTKNRKKSFRSSPFVDKIRDGIWEFYEEGKLKTKSRYKNGKLIREIDIAMMEKYKEKENISGNFKDYWDNATSSVKWIINYKNGEPHGEWKYFNLYNNLTKKEMYHEGKEHGLWETFRYNGQLEKKIGFKHGILSGPYEEYHSNGNLKIIGRFNEGEEEGVWKEYNSNGTLSWKEEYNKGKMVGIWESYDTNGKLYWRFELENNKLKEGGINEMYDGDLSW